MDDQASATVFAYDDGGCSEGVNANAQAAMMSKVMVPQMEKEGYKREFAGAITLASSIIAPIIPPSMIFIIYGSDCRHRLP